MTHIAWQTVSEIQRLRAGLSRHPQISSGGETVYANTERTQIRAETGGQKTLVIYRAPNPTKSKRANSDP